MSLRRMTVSGLIILHFAVCAPSAAMRVANEKPLSNSAELSCSVQEVRKKSSDQIVITLKIRNNEGATLDVVLSEPGHDNARLFHDLVLESRSKKYFWRAYEENQREDLVCESSRRMRLDPNSTNLAEVVLQMPTFRDWETEISASGRIELTVSDGSAKHDCRRVVCGEFLYEGMARSR